MKIENPYKKGSMAYQDFATYVTWYSSESSQYLKEKFLDLQEHANDFLNKSSQSMENSRFHGQCISEIHKALFGEPINVSSEPSEEVILACAKIHKALEARWKAAGSPVHGTEPILMDLERKQSQSVAIEAVGMLNEWIKCGGNAEPNSADQEALAAFESLKHKS